ncbi:hypothetical protein DYL61_18735 [Pseudomonas nabeulensis]|uniref:Uncharacterized protein n=1 Tax=Pseudomonas nabeulensis TaxID=2293833 RepID=A0A4Z0AYV0_9PSED|nr:hypothetical protein DYL61_18735 [Pseudomonas nabeulensis]
MTIKGVTPLGLPMAGGVREERSAPPTPRGHVPCDDQRIAWDVRPREASSSVRYQTLQGTPPTRVNTTPPGQHSTDSQLAGELDKNFGELHAFFKAGRLTQSSLHRIAAQELAGD